MADRDDTNKTLLGYEFVGMMFAVTVGEIGLHAAELANADLYTDGRVWESLPAVSHLLLAAVLVAASWVGWSRTQSPGGASDVKDVLSLRFVVLLVDVLLVVLYFVLVKTVDTQDVSGRLEFRPDAGKEAFWLFVILVVYLLWDVITKGFIAADGDSRHWLMRCFGATCWQRAWVSAACVALGLWSYLAVRGAQSPTEVVVADTGLLSLVLLFRALKDVATALAPKGSKELHEEYLTRRGGRRRALCASVVLGTGMAVCNILVACNWLP